MNIEAKNTNYRNDALLLGFSDLRRLKSERPLVFERGKGIGPEVLRALGGNVRGKLGKARRDAIGGQAVLFVEGDQDVAAGDHDRTIRPGSGRRSR